MTEGAAHRPPLLTEHGIPIRNVWYMLLYTWGYPKSLRRWRSDVEAAPNLEGLLASVLAELVEQRLRIGLGREYVRVDRRLKGIRGRVDFNRSLLDRTFERGEAHCRYESYEVDAPRNRAVRSVLAWLAQGGNFGPAGVEAKRLRHRLRRLVRDLDAVTLIPVDLSYIRRVQVGSNDGDYRLMLAICEFLLESSIPTELGGRRRAPALDRGELTLHAIFESFVAAFYKHHLYGWEVNAQSMLQWPVEEERPLMPRMFPDLLLKRPSDGRMIVLDTKFTANSVTEGRGGKLTYSSGHLYQLYAYLRTQEGRSSQHRSANGILLYPAVGRALSDRFTVQDHQMAIEAVDLAAHWEEIEARLLGLVA